MKKILQKWLGICTHTDTGWKTLGYVLENLEGGALVIEYCVDCRETRIYRV